MPPLRPIMKEDTPTWFKVLNLEASQFEKSRYASYGADEEKFRLKDIGVLRKIAPGVYESAAGEVKEYNDYVSAEGSKINRYKIGKKIGSIPLLDAGLHPELMHDKKAQDKYFKDHPEMRCK